MEDGKLAEKRQERLRLRWKDCVKRDMEKKEWEINGEKKQQNRKE